MKPALSILALAAAFPAFAEDRQLDAHEHGVGALNVAIEGTTVAMELEAPGADIVGFEYEATSDADLSAIDAALATLSAPLELFVLPEAAACTVVKASAEVESEGEHVEHEDEHHDDHADEEHDDHADEEHDDHDDEEHDDHDDEGHDEHGDEHHDEHADEAGHTEFHAKYELKCDNPDALTKITFAYFETFPNALEVELQIINASGAQAFEVERDAPVLDLEH
jgi:hypothetical protein